MSLFIEGTAFPLGKLNVNGWGVPFSEEENAIKTLKTSVVRVCPRDAPHLCDIFEDPFAEIGHVVDAWRDGDDIIAKAEITDSAAAQKIEDGTWTPAWSVYSMSESLDSGGWAHGFEARSMTLVNDPAWDQATWQITASKEGKLSMRTVNKFKIIASKTGETMPDPTPEEKKITELEGQLAEKDGEIAELKTQVSTVEELTASKTELEKKNAEQEKLIASYEKNKATSVPLEKVQELIASKVDEVSTAKLTAFQESQKRTTALASLTAARTELGLETKEDDYQHLTASDLDKLTSELDKIKEVAGKGDPVKYPAGGSGGSVGSWDSTKKEWVI